MTHHRRESYDWYDDAETLEGALAPSAAYPGLPPAWQFFGWWVAGVAFSLVWLLESWTVSSPGRNAVGELAEGVWTLLLSLAICYGTYRFATAQSRNLARVLCISSAVVLLLHHGSATLR
ncbi:hypothetical protein [Microvirga antarctica]|uniref:hypothetical protein n=1 Tax=Microvirga antarctica TaxID=2819233 RepID=UPI001B30E4E6|nr:hypothetical protein [Microvirga antarctica]